MNRMSEMEKNGEIVPNQKSILSILFILLKIQAFSHGDDGYQFELY